MAGHSKWANIKHTKMKEDFRRGQLFSKLTRQIMVAARQGGPDPEHNFRLRLAIEKAREANMPMDNIQRAIRKAVGADEPGGVYEECVFEGYGPGGVAILVVAATDNRNRTSGEIRHLFSRYGGSLAESGSVAWQFEPRGRLVVTAGPGGQPVSEEQLLLDVAEAGGDDVRPMEDRPGWEVWTGPQALRSVREALLSKGYTCTEAGISMVPKTTLRLEGPEAERLLKLVDALENHDDVQEIYANYDIPDEVMEALRT